VSWKRIQLATLRDAAQADILASELFKTSGMWPRHQNVDWLLSWARGRPQNVLLYAYLVNGRISGLAGCIIEDCQIRIGFGSRVALHTFRLKRQRLQEPLLCDSVGDQTVQEEVLCQLFHHIRRCHAGYPLYFEAIAVGSPAHRILTANLIRDSYSVQQYGFETARHVIDAPATYEEDFATIGRETRSGLRRSLKKLFAAYPQQVRLGKFCDRSEVGNFFSEIEGLAIRTWQWRRGDNMSPTIIAKLKYLSNAWADQGFFRGFILYVKDQPVAYIIGYRIGDQFYLEVTGYDWNWKKWSVGIVCILLSLESMLAEHPLIKRYDFLSWEFEYKKRFGNMRWMESNFYAFPDRFRFRLIYLCLKTNIIISNCLRRTYGWLPSRPHLRVAAKLRGRAAQLVCSSPDVA